MECSVCVENYNRSKHSKITCLHCDYHVCKTCVETYLTDNEKEFRSPHCMNCKNLWSEDFIRKQLSRRSLDELDSKRVDQIFDEHVPLIPDIKNLINYEDSIDNKLIHRLNEIPNLIKDLDEEYNQSRNINIKLKIKQLKDEKKFLKDHFLNWKKYKLMTYSEIIPKDIQHRVDLIGINNDQMIGETNGFRDQILSKCPKEDCEGYIMTNSYSCVICDTHICRKCHQIEKDIYHICRLVNIESVNYINDTTKNCPKCFASIQKSDGCDQMWCSFCKHGFEWSSGKAIKNRALHNPEYFQWIKNKRDHNDTNFANLMDQHCTGLPEYNHLIRHMRLVYENVLNIDKTNISDIRTIGNLFNLRVQLEEIYTRKYPVFCEELTAKTHFDLTKKWLKTEISKEELKKELNKIYRKQRINLRITDVFKTFETLTNDLFHKLLYVNDFNISIVDELYYVTHFTNSNFMSIKKVFKSTVPNIIDIWDRYLGRIFKIKTV